jgi:signal transduction histidine kinase
MLYEDATNNTTENIDKSPLYKKSVDVDFYGRVWTFDIESNLAFRRASESYQPTLILLSGIFIDLIILGLFIFLTRANRQALRYADNMNVELKIKTKRLEKSNHDLEEFAYIASHDLKSPLNAMRKLVNWIKEDCIDILPESSLKHIALLENRSDRMSNLLNDLLDYARIERFDYKAETLHLAASTKEVFSLLDHDDNVTLTVLDDVELEFPRIPFEMIMRNLISNAIKHHDKAIIKINVSYVQENNMHKISIEDNGPGIPPELFNKAIEMFQTLKPRDKVEGSGMGLALVNKIILHYEGKMNIESDGICGTRINIMLPLQIK